MDCRGGEACALAGIDALPEPVLQLVFAQLDPFEAYEQCRLGSVSARFRFALLSTPWTHIEAGPAHDAKALLRMRQRIRGGQVSVAAVRRLRIVIPPAMRTGTSAAAEDRPRVKALLESCRATVDLLSTIAASAPLSEIQVDSSGDLCTWPPVDVQRAAGVPRTMRAPSLVLTLLLALLPCGSVARLALCGTGPLDVSLAALDSSRLGLLEGLPRLAALELRGFALARLSAGGARAIAGACPRLASLAAPLASPGALAALAPLPSAPSTPPSPRGSPLPSPALPAGPGCEAPLARLAALPALRSLRLELHPGPAPAPPPPSSRRRAARRRLRAAARGGAPAAALAVRLGAGPRGGRGGGPHGAAGLLEADLAHAAPPDAAADAYAPLAALAARAPPPRLRIALHGPDEACGAAAATLAPLLALFPTGAAAVERCCAPPPALADPPL
eukprot:tig00001371_g8431.t1